TFYNWIERSHPDSPNYAPQYAAFARAIAKAEGELEDFAVRQWVKELPNNWQAARDFLARRFPAQWGNVERRDIQIDGSTMNLQLKGGDEPDDHPPAETSPGSDRDRPFDSALQGGSGGPPLWENPPWLDAMLNDSSERESTNPGLVDSPFVQDD